MAQASDFVGCDVLTVAAFAATKTGGYGIDQGDILPSEECFTFMAPNEMPQAGLGGGVITNGHFVTLPKQTAGPLFGIKLGAQVRFRGGTRLSRYGGGSSGPASAFFVARSFEFLPEAPVATSPDGPTPAQ